MAGDRRLCDHCSSEFKPTRKGHRYCQAKCRVAASRSRRAHGESGQVLTLHRGSGEDSGGSGKSGPIAVDHLLLPAVMETIGKLELDDADAGAVRLAQRYAATIDEARRLAAALDRMPYSEDTFKAVAALKAKVDAQTVLDTLGPKLLDVLQQLGATPKARAQLKGGGAQRGQTSRLAALRSARPD